MAQKEFVREMWNWLLEQVKKEFHIRYPFLIEILDKKERNNYDCEYCTFIEMISLVSSHVNQKPTNRTERAIQSAWFEFSYFVWSTMNTTAGFNRIFDAEQYAKNNASKACIDYSNSSSDPLDVNASCIPANILLEAAYGEILSIAKEA